MNTRDDLSALLDDELDDAELAALEQELQGDDGLRADLEELRGVSEGLASLSDTKAPDGFLAAVMGRIEAGEGLNGDLDAAAPSDGADVIPLIPRVAPTPAVAASAEPTPDNVVRMSWFVKGPILTAIAALLLVGIGISMRDQGPDGPPTAAELAVRAPSSSSPVPTGTLASDMDFDGIVSADAGAEELPRESAERIRMTPNDDRVAVGGAGTGPAVPAAPRKSGIREVPAASPPPGVVAVADGYAPQPDLADGDAFAAASEEIDDVAAEGLVPARARAGALGVAPAAGSDSAASTGSAMSAVASLRTSDGGAVRALRTSADARGWTLTYVSPGDAAVTLSDVQPEQVVELSLPPGAELEAQRVLDSLGSFKFASTPEPTSGNRSTLRITVLFAE